MSVRREAVEREFRHGMRGESAARCIGPITHGCDVFGLTKGDFSMIDILRHVAAQIGPCRIDVGTWTAAHAYIKQAERLLADRNVTAMRWLVDRSFPNRQPAYFRAVIERFGADSVRLVRFHAKFLLLENDSFSVSVRTSMNLNENKRIEFYELSEGSPISDYLREVVDYHFAAPAEDSYAAFQEFRLSEAASQKQEAPVRLGGWD